jgi:hypothetical protein
MSVSITNLPEFGDKAGSNQRRLVLHDVLTFVKGFLE